MAGASVRSRVDRGKRVGEALGVARDQRLAELGLAGEVVVEAGLGDRQLGGDVGVAEAVEAAHLDEPFGDVEDARRAVSPSPPCVWCVATVARFVLRAIVASRSTG